MVLSACSADDSADPDLETEENPASGDGDDGGDGDGDGDGDSTGDGDGDDGGDGDGDGDGDDLPPDPPPDEVPVGEDTVPLEEGEPVSAPANTWTWIPVAGTFCQNGSGTGFGIQINPDSDKLIIYLEGGGACFSGGTCLATLTSYGAGNFGSGPSVEVLSDASPNPFADYSKVYVPYCSGDVHTGTKMDGYGGRKQTGYINLTRDLERIVPTFKGKLAEVVLSGASAGGFGAAWNWMRVQDAFGEVPVHAFDDSAPPMGPEFLSPCLQKHTAEVWGWQDALHPACESCDVEAGRVVRPLMDTSLARQATRYALLSNDEDGTMKSFFAYGEKNCQDLESLFPPIYPTGKYPDGLDELRARIGELDNVGMFQITGGSHVLLIGPGAWTNTKVDGVALLDWVTWFRDGDDKWRNVAP